MEIKPNYYMKVISEVQSAKPEALKSLTQKERKILKVFLEAAKGENLSNAKINAQGYSELLTLRGKLVNPPKEYRQSPLIIRIGKAVLNILQVRISSGKLKELLDETPFSQKINTLNNRAEIKETLVKTIEENAKREWKAGEEIHEKDVKRGGFQVTIEDKASGEKFSNNKYLKNESAVTDFREGLDKFFIEGEENDLRLLTKSMISQTSFNPLIDFLLFNFTQDGSLLKLEVNGEERTLAVVTKEILKKENISIETDKNGIKKLLVKVEGNVPIMASKTMGEFKKDEILFWVKASVRFEAQIDNVGDEASVKIDNLNYNYTLSKQEAYTLQGNFWA